MLGDEVAKACNRRFEGGIAGRLRGLGADSGSGCRTFRVTEVLNTGELSPTGSTAMSSEGPDVSMSLESLLVDILRSSLRLEGGGWNGGFGSCCWGGGLGAPSPDELLRRRIEGYPRFIPFLSCGITLN